MSSLVESNQTDENLISNGLTIVNSFVEQPYHFPHTMTLFQPSKDRYDDPNLQKDEKGLTPFISWYRNHNRKTVVYLAQDYGNNISKLTCFGAGSYEIELATYSPTGIVVEPSDEAMPIPLNMDKFREIRADEDAKNKYSDFHEIDENGQDHIVRKYVFDNGGNKNAKVGFNFNLYDNFISGAERTLRLTVPKDKDFNKLHLKFQCVVNHEDNLLGDYEYIVMVDDEEKYRLSREDVVNGNVPDGEKDIPIDDAVLQSHSFDIKVIVNYQVDFARRSNEKEYQDLLKNSGITLMDIRIENDVVAEKRRLTFSDYVNELGISEDERGRRYEEFWQVSQYKKDIPYQLVLETSLRNITSSGIGYPNNYSTGDIYGDVFVTKSVLDPNYNMNLMMDVWNDNENRWATDEEKTANEKQKSGYLTDMIRAIGREYIGIGQCSDQLFLVFKPTDVAIGYKAKWKDTDGDNKPNPDERVMTRRT